MANDTAGPDGAAKAIASAKDALKKAGPPNPTFAPKPEAKPEASAPAAAKAPSSDYQVARELRDKQDNVDQYKATAPTN